MTPEAFTAVVLARGLGTRMRRDDGTAGLDAGQHAAAAAGLKSMIPDGLGRPFLDHILSSLADGGVRRVILVVAPDHDTISDHYKANRPQRVAIEYAVQHQPLGTADALLSAEHLVGDSPFLALNSDNLYPVAAIRSLVALGEPGLVAFDRTALSRLGNIQPERVAAFAMIRMDGSGALRELIEKPDPRDLERFGSNWVSMNLWRFDAGIFSCCRDVPQSLRGERELPEAVMLGVSRGLVFRAVTMHAAVLDLSNRGDVAEVASRLADAHPNP